MAGSRPSLDTALHSPGCLRELGRDELHHLLAECAAVQSAVVAQLVSLPVPEQPPAAANVKSNDTAANAADEWITAQAAALMLKRSVKSIYRLRGRVPWMRQVGRTLLCSRAGIEKWLERKRVKL
jgi:hypothetical protein